MPGSGDHPSAPDAPGPLTELLRRAGAGDADSTGRLFPLVYAELRRLAQSYLAGERADHTLTATALVHEAYLRLAGGPGLPSERGAFCAIAAQAMRRILVDHARTKKAAKRGGGQRAVALDDAVAAFEERAIDLVRLDDALERLRTIDEQKARIVELRFFGGLTAEETANAMSVGLRTVERDWAMARAWLRGQVAAGPPGNA